MDGGVFELIPQPFCIIILLACFKLGQSAAAAVVVLWPNQLYSRRRLLVPCNHLATSLEVLSSATQSKAEEMCATDAKNVMWG